MRKSLAEMSQHSELNKLRERFLSLEAVRLEASQQLTTRDEGGPALASWHLSKSERHLMDDDCATKDQSPPSDVTELQDQLRHALEKNKQWLEYDQQRGAYVRAFMGRMLWLETQLGEANQACSQQHKKEHSDERDRIRQMQEHYERLLQKARDELKLLREHVNMALQDLIRMQNWCKEKEIESDQLRQLLQTHRLCSEDEEHQLMDQTKELQDKLDEERRRSANLELQSNLFRRFMINQHHADQEKIAALEQQIKINRHDLEHERKDCSYVKKQMIRVLRTMQRRGDHVRKKLAKRHRRGHSSCETSIPPPRPSSDSPTAAPLSRSPSGSFLECPGCRAEYPASHHRELLIHLDVCLD